MKHPVFENRAWLITWWLVWLIIGGGQSLLFYFAYGSLLKISILDGVLSLVLYSGIALAIWYPFRYINYSNQKNLVALISNLTATGAITVGIWIIATHYLIVSILADEMQYQAYWKATLPFRIGTGVFIYGLTILTYYLFVSLTNLADKKAREARLESLVKETELKMLRSQINPHFLFNSLNSINSLTITDPEKARIMVIKLSEFLRYALSRKDEQPVSLESELDNLRLYLDIEKIRFGNRLETEEDIEIECLGIKIPAMLLQPLYENAIKHGVYESIRNIRIFTFVRLIRGFMEIAVSNNFDTGTSPVKGTGTGLINVSRRIELFYGNKGSMQTIKENGIFTVKLFIPVNDINKSTIK